MTNDRYSEADALYRAGDLIGCHEVAWRAVAAQPDDIRLLRLAAACSMELGLPDAEEAFRRLLRRNPTDVAVMVDLAHIVYAEGRQDEAVTILTDAAEADPGNVAVLRSLAEMLRRVGDPAAALDRVRQLTGAHVDDAVTLLDLAELQLLAGRLDDAFATYRRLADVDEEGHRIFAWHGMIAVEIRRERWRRALDLAIEATDLDRHRLTTELLANVAAHLFGEGDRPPPPWPELSAALAAEQAGHRRAHLETLVG